MNTTDGKAVHITRPAVLTALCCITCLYILLCGKFSVTMSVIICFVCTLICCTISFFNDGFKAVIILLLFVSASCIHGVFTYYNVEKQAIEFISENTEKAENVYKIKITSAKSYSSLTSCDGIILSVNNETCQKQFKCRLTFHDGKGLSSGNIVYIQGSPTYPSNEDDDGFDNISYQRSRKRFITFSYATILSAKGGEPSLRNRIHKYIERVIYRNVPHNRRFDTADISYSMLLGDKKHLDSDLKDDFTKSGIIHLLCVSGMHLSVIMGALYSLLRFSSLKPRYSAIILTSFCLIYLAVIGFPMAALRASIICIIGYGAMLFGRSTEGYTSLAFSAIVICVISPYSVLDISAQLSFLSSLGIITATYIFNSRQRAYKNFFEKFSYTVIILLINNFAAVVFTCLFAADSFGGISLTSVPATLLTSFVSEILIIFLLALIILSPFGFLEPLMVFIGFICRTCAYIIISVAKYFSDLRYSYPQIGSFSIAFAIFIIIVFILTIFIYYDRRDFITASFYLCSVLCIFTTFIYLTFAIIDDSDYKISYFRQNEKDRQLSIKLARDGYFIVNADSSFCSNPSKADFDTKDGNNYILIIPDEIIYPSVLCDNLRIFNDRYGIKDVFVPANQSGKELKDKLFARGCNVKYISTNMNFGNINLDFKFKADSTFLTVQDGKTKTSVLFADEFSPEHFSSSCDIAAYFTRKTKNQFDINTDTVPECDLFVTRLKKEQKHDKIYNTFGKKSFYIKE